MLKVGARDAPALARSSPSTAGSFTQKSGKYSGYSLVFESIVQIAPRSNIDAANSSHLANGCCSGSQPRGSSSAWMAPMDIRDGDDDDNDDDETCCRNRRQDRRT
jgi:hypothetical protein